LRFLFAKLPAGRVQGAARNPGVTPTHQREGQACRSAQRVAFRADFCSNRDLKSRKRAACASQTAIGWAAYRFGTQYDIVNSSQNVLATAAPVDDKMLNFIWRDFQ
jgi:hypothetical protein